MYADSVHTAYRELLKNQLGSAVFISDLAKKARVSISEMRQWINAEARAGRAILYVGHWPSATPEQRSEAGISATKHGERSAARPKPMLKRRRKQPWMPWYNGDENSGKKNSREGGK
jgi:hypothetical protein